MALHKLRGYWADPRDAVKFWIYDSIGRILTDKTDFKGIAKITKTSNVDIYKIAEYANAKNKAVALRCKYPSSYGYHYVFATRVQDGVIYFIDPLDKDAKEVRDLAGRYEIIGMRLIEGDPNFVSEWAEENWERGKKDGMAINDPKEKCDIMKFQLLAKAAGLKIKNEEAEMSMERAVELIYRWKDEVDRYKNL